MARKTIPVEEIVVSANRALESDEFDASFRMGVAVMAEVALFRTGNYKGFKYQSSEWDESTNSLREGYDDTRRIYF